MEVHFTSVLNECKQLKQQKSSYFLMIRLITALQCHNPSNLIVKKMNRCFF